MKRAILIVDHGSRRSEANALLEEVAERVRARVPDRVVEIAHMELAPPSIADGIAACAAAGADEVAVFPWFLAAGSHTSEDVPRLVREAASRHGGLRVFVSEPFGLHENLVEVLLERIDEAARRR